MPKTQNAATKASKPAAKAKPAAKPAAKAATAFMPEGFHTLTPSLTVSHGEAAIAFYEKALGAKVEVKMRSPGSKRIMHASLLVGNSKMFVQDEMPNMPGPKQRHSSFYVYVPDVDAAHKRAVDAGMKELFLPTDMFWGDRTSVAACSYGHHWTFATHVKDPSKEEMAEAMKNWGAKASA